MMQWFAVVGLLAPALMAGADAAQGPAKLLTEKQTKAAMETIQGTIDFMERLGGYFIRGQNPGGEFFIDNQNPKVLKGLKESGKTVTIQGYITNQGAEYFYIQKIDGKKYTGSKSTK